MTEVGSKAVEGIEVAGISGGDSGTIDACPFTM